MMATNSKAIEQWIALAEEASRERPFGELSLDERRRRLQKVIGAGRGVCSSSLELALQKAGEIQLGERKFQRFRGSESEYSDE